MGAYGKVIGLVASPNRAGRTNQLVAAALNGAARAGAPTELIQMVDYVVAACKAMDSLIEVTRVYEVGVKAFEDKQ
jgi:multimeric flavodoxin WrbA